MSSFNQNAIKHKTTLLNLAAELGNVSKACKRMGFSRDTFYRYQKAVAEGGLTSQGQPCYNFMFVIPAGTRNIIINTNGASLTAGLTS